MALAVAGAKKIESGSANSVTVNAAYTATTGNLMVVGVTAFSNSNNLTGNAAASDNANGAYTVVGSNTTPTSNGVTILYHKNITGGSLNLTATGQTNGASVVASFHEVSGADTTAPFTTGEFSATGSTTATTNPQTGSVTNSVADSVFFAALANTSGSGTSTLTVNSTGSTPTGWALKNTTNSQEVDGLNFETLSMPFLIVASSAATKHGWTTNSAKPAMVIACFGMAASGGGGTSQYFPFLSLLGVG